MKNILCFDADDTLWECNIYYKKVMNLYSYELSQLFSLDENFIYQTILKYEHERLKEYGYGSFGFRQCLKDVFTDFYNHYHVITNYHKRMMWIDEITRPVIEFEINLLPFVEETLLELQKRNYRLFLLTKGDYHEQKRKIDNSNLLFYFESYRIMEEKHEDAYLEFLEDHRLLADQTVMIGNSPKSDILPCLNIDMKAIYIPHDHNWELEHREIPENHKNLMVLDSIKQLLSHFN